MAGNYDNDNGPGDGWEIDGDLDKAETRKEVPPGRWLTKIVSMEKKPTKNKEKDYFNLSFEVVDALTPETEQFVGSRVWDIFNINQEALWKLKALISACGFDASGSRIPNLTGCEVILDTFEDDYQGNKSIKTKRYKNPEQEGWNGLHETRDATTGSSAKDKKDDAKSASAPKAASGAGLSGKKLAPGGGKAKPPQNGDDEVEI